MTQYRRRVGAETYTMKDCPNHDGKVDIFDSQGFKYPTGCISREAFEREYEPVLSEDVVAGIVDEALGRMSPEQADEAIDKIKAIRDQVRARNLASLKLADELAGAIGEMRHCKTQMTSDVQDLCGFLRPCPLHERHQAEAWALSIQAALSAYLESRKGR